jgi:CheY-like chemotaxis protein
MPLTLILSVGSNSSLFRARSLVLQSAGYTVVSSFSIREAAGCFLNGDFDLVLLDDSLPTKDSDRLTCLIRASGSLTPVVSIALPDGYVNHFAHARVESDPNTLRIGVKRALANAAKRLAVS